LNDEIDERETDVMFKLCIFGDGGVGKTTLLGRYLTGIFKANQSITIGVDFHVKKLEVNGKKVLLQIWDFAGEKRFRFLLPSYVLGASGGIFMYDITRYSSLKNFPEWVKIFKNGFIEPFQAKKHLIWQNLTSYTGILNVLQKTEEISKIFSRKLLN